MACYLVVADGSVVVVEVEVVAGAGAGPIGWEQGNGGWMENCVFST
jgi:hypothetical protein